LLRGGYRLWGERIVDEIVVECIGARFTRGCVGEVGAWAIIFVALPRALTGARSIGTGHRDWVTWT